MQTLLLTQDEWDLCLDINGDIAVASEPYAVAQDIASGCKTYLGECWYNTAIGVNYPAILGKRPAIGYVKNQYITMALRVPTVTVAKCYLTSVSQRGIGGQIIAQSGGTEIEVGL